MKSNQKLKVCMLIDAWFPFVGGGQIHVKHLVGQLKHNHQVRVTLFHSPHHHLLIRALWNIWVIPQVIYQYRKNKFELIHAHAFSAGFSAKIIASILKIPLVFTVHGSHLMDSGSKGLKAWGERLLLTQIKYSKQISVTKSFLDYPNVNKDIAVINNGVELSEFTGQKVKKSKQFTFLYVGRDHPSKGINFLRQAFKQVNKNFPQTRLKLVTKGKITGKRLAKIYLASSAFVLPSLVEGQPLTLLEAWAAKLPTVATRTPGVNEIASNNKNAILVKPGSSSSLVKAMMQILQMSRSARLKLGISGYNKVKKNFAWDKIAKKTFDIYLSLI